MLGARHPKRPGRVYAGADALAVDLVAARHLGVSDPFGSTYLRTAIHWFGDPRGETSVIGDDTPVPGWRTPYRYGIATPFMFLAAFVYAHMSGRGALFVPVVDEAAFPVLKPPGVLLRFGRAVVRWFFDLAAPR
jgi:hypothetical protein